MAKLKNKQKSTLNFKNKTQNPFEVHVNKQKFHVLGRKLKTDRGLPGLARAKSIKKRKETLLQEYKVKHKSNRFLDRRIGEKNASMTKEDRIMARFTAERMKLHNKKTMYNLGDDEILTHKGRSLAEVEATDDPRSDDDDDFFSKSLNADFVEGAHFGGGVLKKSEGGGRAAVIEQLIAESKNRKAEKAREKEKTLSTTEKLDSEWKDLIPLLATGKKPEEDEPPVKKKKNDYDLLLGELRFEARGTPQDKLKNDNELAIEEAKKLALLEEDRQRRMRGYEDEPKTLKPAGHRSADDLDDGFDLDEQESSYVLTYDKEGKPVGLENDGFTKKRVEINLLSKNEEEDGSQDEETYEAEESDEDGPEDLSDLKVDQDENEINVSDDEDHQDSPSKETNAEKPSPKKENKNKIKVPESTTDMDDDDDNYKLISSSNVSIENQNNFKTTVEGENFSNKTLVKEDEKKGKGPKEKKKVSFSTEVKTVNYTKESNNKMLDTISKQNFEKYGSELPFTFEIPETHEEFRVLLKERKVEEKTIIIARMIKCNHPSLKQGNNLKLEQLFKFLLQFLVENDFMESFKLIHYIAEHLFTLAHFSPVNSANSFSEMIIEKQTNYKDKKLKYPEPNILIILKLIPLLFPTSDKKHQVTTPAALFITMMLRNCHVTTKRSIATGLFLVTLLTQFVNLSKRFLPEAINFICGIIHMATDVGSTTIIQPPFKKEYKILYLQEPNSNYNGNLKMIGSDLLSKSGKIDDEFRIRSLLTTLKLALMFCQFYEELPAAYLLLKPVEINVQQIKDERFPVEITQTKNKILNVLKSIAHNGLPAIAEETKKPKALRLYEPSIQPVYENSKKKKLSNDEHSALLSKYKKEMKGALREIRRDRSFLAAVKFKEQAESDAERMRRVKQIYSWGAQQQGELNKMERKKKK